MESFDECFSNFLTNCRDKALEELRSNKGYSDLKKVQDDLRTKLKAVISPEAQAIFENFLDAAVSVKGMECNKTLLCGLSLSAEIQKRYDASTVEYKALESEYL